MYPYARLVREAGLADGARLMDVLVSWIAGPLDVDACERMSQRLAEISDRGCCTGRTAAQDWPDMRLIRARGNSRAAEWSAQTLSRSR